MIFTEVQGRVKFCPFATPSQMARSGNKKQIIIYKYPQKPSLEGFFLAEGLCCSRLYAVLLFVFFKKKSKKKLKIVLTI